MKHLREFLNDLPNLWMVVAVLVGLLWFAGYHAAASLVLVVGVAAYAVELVVWPWMKCRKCDATGETWSPFSQTFKTCSRCGGLRKHVRWGRRVWTWSTNVNEDRK